MKRGMSLSRILRPTAIERPRVSGRLATLLCVALAALACVIRANPSEAAGDLPILRGMSLGLYSADPEHSYVEEIREIRDLGANAVALVVVLMQDSISATQIRAAEGRTVPDERLAEAIREARRRDLQVFVLPIVLLEHAGQGDWRGRLAPADVDAWFTSYRRRLLHIAGIAECEGATLFAVGSEFNSLEHDERRWRDTIAKVRRVFSGRLTYSMNWDHLDTVRFWDALDAVSVSAYFELTQSPNASEEALEESWRGHRDQLLAWHARATPAMPLIISEVGYPSEDGAAQHPWDYTLDRPVNLEEQRRCYAAFIRAWNGVPALRGVFFYEWSGDGGGPEDASYTPHGKPAEALIRDWFTRGAVPAPDSLAEESAPGFAGRERAPE
jgi:hypothetical protein